MSGFAPAAGQPAQEANKNPAPAAPGSSDSSNGQKSAVPPAGKADTAAGKNPAGIVLPTAPKPVSGADSLARAHKRDSLAGEIVRRKERPMRFPAALDSVFSSSTLEPWQLFHSDASGVSEAARALPQVVYVPYSLTSQLNRFMLYGFPLLPNAAAIDNGAFYDNPSPVSGSDGLFCTQVDQVRTAPPYGLSCSQLPYGLVVPHADVLWENGAFSENLLGVRFARPLTKNTDIGVFSNYRYSAPFTYSTANDMQSLFGYAISDTSLLANNGRNPLSNESRVSLRLDSHSEQWGTASLSYSYRDLQNDMAMQYTDTVARATSLQWKKITAFGNELQAQVRALPVGRLAVNADAKAVLEGHTADYPFIVSAIPVKQLGRNSELSGMLEPYLALGADTFLVNGAGQHIERVRYDQSLAKVTIGDFRLAYRRAFSLNEALGASVNVSGGGGTGTMDMPFRNDNTFFLVYDAQIAAHAGKQSIRLFATRDLAPVVLPYDTAVSFATLFDAYQAYGADVFLEYKKIGLSAGVCGETGLDSSGALLWPDRVMPYRQPDMSFFVEPLFGRWLGFALSSRLMLTDARPYFKSQSSLSYEAHPLGGKEHITVDLLYDFWSRRDPLTYGGISLWSRELSSLSLRLAVHIQGFNLFYKVDNVLNRKYAYVPGYFMPGITFRWGFQWLIQ
ncbi:MAG TPA: hypothetical protein VLX68_11945 [Chitinivibrionales bacterium]|nr:hypothetical protein [Chitinivibrionales bacterium]